MNADNIVRIGLIQSIETDWELIQKSGKLTTSLQLSGEETRILPKKSLLTALYRRHYNIIKHAKATRISIVVKYTEAVLLISVSDNEEALCSPRIPRCLV